jgi:hypothetical protein
MEATEQRLYSINEIRQLEQIVKEDLENATVSSASIHVRPDGRITLDELVLRLDDGRLVSPSLPDAEVGTAANMRLEVYDDRHGWREATVQEDYPEVLEDLVRVWHPEPDTVEEARL